MSKLSQLGILQTSKHLITRYAATDDCIPLWQTAGNSDLGDCRQGELRKEGKKRFVHVLEHQSYFSKVMPWAIWHRNVSARLQVVLWSD